MRTDCDEEFYNKMIKNYLFSKNIKHEIITPRADKIDLLRDRIEQLLNQQSLCYIQRNYHCIYKVRRNLLKIE